MSQLPLSDSISDWIWPRLQGKAEESPRDRCYFDASHAAFLPTIEGSIRTLAEQGEERLSTVERKLIALLTLTAVLGAAIAASFVAVAVLDQVRDSRPTVIVAGAVITLVSYTLVQIVCSLMATLRGMMRRGYKRLTPEGITPQVGDTSDVYSIRLLNYQVQNVIWNDWVVNGKVSDMNIAHVALRNALWGTCLLLGAAFILAVLQLREV